MDYTFRDSAGVVHIESQTVSSDVYDSHRTGHSLRVTYLPDQPRTSRPLARAEITWVRIARDCGSELAVSIGMLLVAPYFVRAIARANRQSLHLARNGVAVAAEVVDLTRGGLRYRFTVGGTAYEGTRRFAKPFSVPPKAGDRVVALYDPANPRQSMPALALTGIDF